MTCKLAERPRLAALVRLLKRDGGTMVLDGDICICRVGVVRGDDARSYAVYQYTYIFGEAGRAHNRILLIEGDRRYVGSYYYGPVEVTLRGADILLTDEGHDMGRIHIGKNGPRREVRPGIAELHK